LADLICQRAGCGRALSGRQRAYCSDRCQIAAKQLRYRQRHRAEARARTREWYAANRARAIETVHDWRSRHPGYSGTKARDWVAKHPDRAAEARREWVNGHANELAQYRRDHAPIANARRRARRRDDASYRNRQREIDRKRYLRDREKRLAYLRKWRSEHIDEVRNLARRREARLRGAVGSHTAREWYEKLELFAHLCAYCGEAKPLTEDHRIPVSRGGSDYIENIVPACRPCNSRKRTKTDLEFIAERVA